MIEVRHARLEHGNYSLGIQFLQDCHKERHDIADDRIVIHVSPAIVKEVEPILFEDSPHDRPSHVHVVQDNQNIPVPVSFVPYEVQNICCRVFGFIVQVRCLHEYRRIL